MPMVANAEKGFISTMSDPLAEDYLRWLEPQIRDKHGNPNRTYWDLLIIMHEKEFVWLIPNDDNRLVDGLDLRVEFAYANHIRSDALRNVGPCSFLEVLIGLSRRIAFAAGGKAPGWAWQLLNNLELHRTADPVSRRKATFVNDVLDTVIWRTYAPDGSGGFFPLNGSDEDQRQIELWYQMSAFIDEIHPEY